MTLNFNWSILSDDEHSQQKSLSNCHCGFDVCASARHVNEKYAVRTSDKLSVNQNQPLGTKLRDKSLENTFVFPQTISKEQRRSTIPSSVDPLCDITNTSTNSISYFDEEASNKQYQNPPIDAVYKLSNYFESCRLSENKFNTSGFSSCSKTTNPNNESTSSSYSSNPFFIKRNYPLSFLNSSPNRVVFNQQQTPLCSRFATSTNSSLSSNVFLSSKDKIFDQSSIVSSSPSQIVPTSVIKSPLSTTQESSSSPIKQSPILNFACLNKHEYKISQQSFLSKRNIYIMSSIEQLETLRNAELYDDCKTLAEFILTLDECGKDYLNNEQRLTVYRCLADSTWFLHEYHLAESYFKKALHSYKQLDKYDKNALEPDWIIEYKYRQHVCLLKLNRLKDALTVLESITFQQRTAKIHLALGQCYQKVGSSVQESISAYRECLKQNPNALSAYIALLALGIKLSDLLHTHPSAASIHHENQAQQPTPVTISPLVRQQWFRSLLQADAFSTTRDFAEASRHYQQIDAQYLPQSTYVLCQLGYNQYLNGDYAQALHSLQRAQQIDPLLLKHMDILAFLTYTECKDNSLEKLVNHLMSLGDHHPETWIAIGYYCLKKNHKPSRTVYLAQKAYALDNTRIQALLLKGLALFKLKRYSDSLVHYKEAVRLMPYCFEGYKGVVDGYLATNRSSDANMFITNAVRTNLKENVRAFTLCGQVLAKEPSSLDKARVYLEKALVFNAKYTDAVIALVEVYGQLKQPQKSIELLKEHVQMNNDPRIRQLLIENLMKSGSNEEMLQQVRNYPTTHFEREMNDDSSYDGGRFDTGAMGDLDPMCDDVIGENFSDEDL